MPRFDQTGPVGKGPQTGGCRGVCGHANTLKNREKAFGRDHFRLSDLENDVQAVTGRAFRHRRKKGSNGEGQRYRFRGGQA